MPTWTHAAPLALLLLWQTPALGAPDHPAPAHGEPAHGDAGHGEASDHDAGQGHHYYTDDDDQDGIPNWRDSKTHLEDNKDTYVLKSVGFHAFNLMLLIGILVYFLRGTIMDTLRDRALGIRKELTDSARRRDEAHQRHQELIARLEKIEGEVETMSADATAEAKLEEQKLVERAEREAVRIGEQAERSIRDEGTRARNALRREAVQLAVQLAEETLKAQVSTNDQRALAKNFLDVLSATPTDEETRRG